MNDFLTEQKVISLLISGAKENNEVSPRVIVVQRTQKYGSLTRKSRFALIVNSDNLDLIDGMIKITLEYPYLSFVGSEVNLQGDMNITYLFFEASIIAQTNTKY